MTGIDEPPRTRDPALINCDDCGWAISRNAFACPRCGRRYKPLTVDHTGWPTIIGAGIIMGGVLLGLVLFGLFVLLGIIGSIGSHR